MAQDAPELLPSSASASTSGISRQGATPGSSRALGWQHPFLCPGSFRVARNSPVLLSSHLLPSCAGTLDQNLLLMRMCLCASARDLRVIGQGIDSWATRTSTTICLNRFFQLVPFEHVCPLFATCACVSVAAQMPCRVASAAQCRGPSCTAPSMNALLLAGQA